METYLRALSYFRKDSGKILVLLLIIFLSTFFGLLQAWPVAILIDSVLSFSPKQDFLHRFFLSLLPESKVGQIMGLGILAFLLKVGQEGLEVIRILLNHSIGYNGLLRIRCEIFRKLQALGLSFHRSQSQGDLIYRLTSDTFGLHNILGVGVSTLVASITLLVMVSLLLTRNIPLTLLALSVAPLLILANLWFGRTLSERSLRAKEVDSEFTSIIQRSISSVGLVQAFCREETEFGRFESTVKRNIQAWFQLHSQEVSYRLSVALIFAVGGSIILSYGGYLVYRDQFLNPIKGGMTIGDLMIFLSYLGMLYDPLCKLTGASASIQGGLAGAKRVFEILDEETSIKDPAYPIELPRQSRVIELSRIEFYYQKGHPILKQINVTIQPGQMVAFVGPSGEGKSTLLNLLPRFYDPTEGEVRLDGIDLRRVSLKDLRHHIALVLQESLIFPTTIAENIAYGCPDATFEEIQNAATMAGASSFIESLPDQYHTKLNEGGMNLSGGQRQRLAIARALLTEAPIIVLDEPTSSLDPEHEAWVIETLQALKRKRTIILVSHRLSTVVDCDQIFVMKRGEVVESGTHRSLLSKEGIYSKMAKLQMKGEERNQTLNSLQLIHCPQCTPSSLNLGT